jgi:phosphoserine phosphatase
MPVLMDKERCEQYCFQKIRSYPKEPKPEMKQIKLVLFDMDGVLTDTVSSWRFIHEHFGVSNEHSVRAYVSGEIDDMEFIRRDVDLWRTDGTLIHSDVLKELLYQIPIMAGAKTCVQWLHANSIRTAIVSAGLDTLANRVASELGINYVYANGIKEDESGLLATEGILRVPLLKKDRVVDRISKELGVPREHMAAVGNSCYDLPMLRKVPLGIAFNPSDECVCEEADLIVMGRDLTELVKVFERYI